MASDSALVEFTPTQLDLREAAAGVGKPVAVRCENVSGRRLSDMSARLTGPGAQRVQLASDIEPRAWAAAGESVILQPPALEPGGRSKLWARAAYSPDDPRDPFDFVMVFDMEITS